MKLEFTRKIDDLGRINIPKELLSNLQLSIGDTVSLCCTSDAVAMYVIKNNQEPELNEAALLRSTITTRHSGLDPEPPQSS